MLITILLFSLSVMSEGIDRTTALKRAQAFMPGKQFVTGKKYVILGHLSARKVRTEACGYCYSGEMPRLKNCIFIWQ